MEVLVTSGDWLSALGACISIASEHTADAFAAICVLVDADHGGDPVGKVVLLLADCAF